MIIVGPIANKMYLPMELFLAMSFTFSLLMYHSARVSHFRRSSGRIEKFDTNRLAQTVSRSGVPFLMARDIAKKATKKIKSQITSPVREDNHMNKKRERELYPEDKN